MTNSIYRHLITACQQIACHIERRCHKNTSYDLCTNTINTFSHLSGKKKLLAERGFDPRTSGLWAQHASTAPLCLAANISYQRGKVPYFCLMQCYIVKWFTHVEL